MLRLLLAASQTWYLTALASPASPQNGGAHVIKLDGRQLPSDPTVPTQCQSDCTPTILSILQSNQCSIATCCSSNFAMGFFNCADCVGQASGTSNFTAIQTVLDDLHNECASVGISIPKLTFPGQNPNRQLSSVASTRPAATSSQKGASSSAPSSNTSGTPSPTAITQITITSVSSTPTSPSIAQSTVTTLPTNSAASSAGTYAICALFIQPWAIASIIGMPLLGMLYLGV